MKRPLSQRASDWALAIILTIIIMAAGLSLPIMGYMYLLEGVTP